MASLSSAAVSQRGEDRTAWVDYAKAIGILLVVFGHVLHGTKKAGLPLDEQRYALVESIIYSFHMPLFFFLSGLFICQSLARRGFAGFTLAKADTILYPYVVWSVIQGGVVILMSSYLQRDFDVMQIVSLLWAPQDQFWFLHALFIQVMVIGVVLRYCSQRLGLGLLLGGAGALYFAHGWLPNVAAVRDVTDHLIYTVFGVVAGLTLQFSESRRMVVPVVAALSAFILMQMAFHVVGGNHFLDFGWFALATALVSIGSVVVLSIALARRGSAVLALIGYHAVVIFLLHVFVITAVRMGLAAAGVDSISWHLLLGTVLGVGLPLLPAVVVSRWKIPYIFSGNFSQWRHRARARTAMPSAPTARIASNSLS